MAQITAEMTADRMVGRWPLEMAAPRAPRPRPIRAALLAAALAGAVGGALAGSVLTAVANPRAPRVARVSPVVERAVSAVDWRAESAPRTSPGLVRIDHMYEAR